MVGPDYVKPPVLTPEKFKELKGNLVKGWKLATPRDCVDAGPWWVVYKDPTLDQLEEQVELSNQNVAAAVEAYEQARALIREAQAALFPTVTTGYSTTRQYTGAALFNTRILHLERHARDRAPRPRPPQQPRARRATAAASPPSTRRRAI